MAAWNSNGLQQRALEIKTFIYNNNIDILLVSETHFTTKSYMKIPYYTIYDTKHLSRKAHGGIAVIVRNDIKHYLHSQVNKEYLQATTVTVQTSSNYFQLSAVYVPPRHKITSQMWCSGTRQQTSQRFLSRASLLKDSTLRTDDCQMSIHSHRIFTASLRTRYKS